MAGESVQDIREWNLAPLPEPVNNAPGMSGSAAARYQPPAAGSVDIEDGYDWAGWGSTSAKEGTVHPMAPASPTFNMNQYMASEPVYNTPTFFEHFMYGDRKADQEYSQLHRDWERVGEAAVRREMGKDPGVDAYMKASNMAAKMGDFEMSQHLHTQGKTLLDQVNKEGAVVQDIIKAAGTKKVLWRSTMGLIEKQAGVAEGQPMTEAQFTQAVKELSAIPELFATILRNSVMIIKPENMTDAEYGRISSESKAESAAGILEWQNRTGQHGYRALHNLIQSTHTAYSSLVQDAQARVNEVEGRTNYVGKTYEIPGLDVPYIPTNIIGAEAAADQEASMAHIARTGKTPAPMGLAESNEAFWNRLFPEGNAARVTNQAGRDIRDQYNYIGEGVKALFESLQGDSTKRYKSKHYDEIGRWE